MEDALAPPNPDEGTWRCQSCGSVCTLRPEDVPPTCQFCDSNDIVLVAPAPADAG